MGRSKSMHDKALSYASSQVKVLWLEMRSGWFQEKEVAPVTPCASYLVALPSLHVHYITRHMTFTSPAQRLGSCQYLQAKPAQGHLYTATASCRRELKARGTAVKQLQGMRANESLAHMCGLLSYSIQHTKEASISSTYLNT